ncbi:hypothetical protein P8452_45215 [Trifolium repens]|nr:hypothetical protein P8452_45215 [Trifolium repens]
MANQLGNLVESIKSKVRSTLKMKKKKKPYVKMDKSASVKVEIRSRKAPVAVSSLGVGIAINCCNTSAGSQSRNSPQFQAPSLSIKSATLASISTDVWNVHL